MLQAYTSDHPADQVKDWQRSWQTAPTSEVTCRACGCSDNTIGHWTRWCPVPLIVALSILRPTCWVDNIGQLARMGVKHAVTCTLVLAAFRRLLRQEGAFLHQKCSDPKDVLWWTGSLLYMEWSLRIPISNWGLNSPQELGRWGVVASPPIESCLKKCFPWTTALYYSPRWLGSA